ncbi:hypothetical protein QYS62_011376 [Fusarium acuminatum]|uniref:Potassium channel domain-containing protein n=1 Tax=Fusarium acuminatum TaxID=5515 RepID=A0ABZ2XBT7_9HYPO
MAPKDEENLSQNLDLHTQSVTSNIFHTEELHNDDVSSEPRYASSLCRTALSATAARPLKDVKISEDEIIWSQSFYYGMWAAILYFIDASLLTITFWGASTGHYRKDLLLTTSQRTLMLQSILLLIYLLLGAYMFSEIESWNYLDTVYWTVVTLFTVGFGDYHPVTDLGRAILIPFALAGIISLGLVISSVRNLVLESGGRCVGARIDNKKRGRMIRKMLLSGDDKTLEPIHGELQTSLARSDEPRQSEFERRNAEFDLMRKIQARSSTRRRWVAMAISTFSWLVMWLLGALIFEKTEKAYQSWSYFDALYFSFEAWTTIGYGDLTPVSNAGRSFYVFWSLLALPTMTVVISHASDTVVRLIRDVTLLVGDITILPNDRGFIRNVKSLVSKITFGKVFGDQDLGPSNPAVSSKDINQRLAGTAAIFHGRSLQNNGRSLIGGSVAGQPVSPITGLRDNRVRLLSTSDVHCSLHEPSTGTNFQLLLMSEIRDVIGHLKESKPHHYTFNQWAWYLKLIGEDENSPQTHCKVSLEKACQDINKGAPDGGLKWSWVGNHSPLLGTQEESEWILGRLMDKLEESLLKMRTRQFGNGSTMSLPEARHNQDLAREGCVSPSRGWNTESSACEQMIASPESPETATPPTIYVIGDTRYINIQKPGRAVGGWKTPANRIIIENKTVVTLPAVVASGKGAITMAAKVPTRM